MTKMIKENPGKPDTQNIDDNSSLTYRTYNLLKKMILCFELKPKETINISSIEKMHGISRTPIREALLLLEKDGLVKMKSGKGAVVLSPSLESLRETVQVKTILEIAAFKAAIDNMTDEDFTTLEGLLLAAEKALRDNNFRESETIGAEFHMLFVKKSGNQVLINTIEYLQNQVDRIRPIIWAMGKENISRSAKEHRKIFLAARDKNASRVEKLLLDHALSFEVNCIPQLDMFLG